MTAAKADEWLPCNPGTEALRLPGDDGGSERRLSVDAGRGGVRPDGAADHGLGACVQGRRDAGGRGGRERVVHLAECHGGIPGRRVTECRGEEPVRRVWDAGFAPAAPGSGATCYSQVVQTWSRQMKAGQVGALLILGQSNPAFTLPLADGFASAAGQGALRRGDDALRGRDDGSGRRAPTDTVVSGRLGRRHPHGHSGGRRAWRRCGSRSWTRSSSAGTDRRLTISPRHPLDGYTAARRPADRPRPSDAAAPGRTATCGTPCAAHGRVSGRRFGRPGHRQ